MQFAAKMLCFKRVDRFTLIFNLECFYVKFWLDIYCIISKTYCIVPYSRVIMFVYLCAFIQID